MAPKREKSLLENPPAASTSEDEDVEDEEEEEEVEEEVHEVDEEEEEEEEEEDDEEEEEDEATTGKPNSSSAVKNPKSDPTPSSGSKPQTPSSEEEEEEEEEEEDESDESDSEPTPPKIKPLEPSRSSNPSGGKPIVSQPKKTAAKPSTTPSATAKRPLESENDSKRKKKKVDDEDSNPEESEVRSTFGPKSIFKRLWSDEDEIVVLRGMIEFKKKGVDPFSDLTEFLDSIKRHLHVVVKTDQLNNKIKRLKKKYLNNYKRGKGDEDPVFSKPHDVITYELMKEIWGGKEGNIREINNKEGTGVVANGKQSKSKKSNKTLSLSDISMRESSKMDERNGSMHPCVQGMVHSGNNNMVVGGSFLKEGLGLIGDSKSKDLEKKWKSLYAAELQVYLRRVELVREQTIAILEAHKSSDA